jgi:AraC family transcriptional regulator, arabinose operon regulatory protein
MRALIPFKSHLNSAGRHEWPGKVTRCSPWLAPRRIQNHEIWFVWSGIGTVRKDGHAFDIKGGEIFLFHEGHTYEVTQNPDHPLGINWIDFRIEFAGDDPTGQQLYQAQNLVTVVDSIFAEAVSRKITELLWEAYIDAKLKPELAAPEGVPNPMFTKEDELTRSSAYCPIPIHISVPLDPSLGGAIVSANAMLTSLLTELLHQSQRDQIISSAGLEKYHRKLITSLAMQIQENPGKYAGVNDIAQSVGYSSDHFSRVFKKITGYAPRQFLINARIAKAQHYLRGSDLSIKEISNLLGYCSTFFFSRQFKEFVSETPSGFRHNHHHSRETPAG